MRAGRWIGRALLTGATAGALVLACGDDSEQAPVTFPEQGDGGATSSSGSSGGSSSSGSTSSSSGGSGGTSRPFCVVMNDLLNAADACCTGADRTTQPYEYLKLISTFSKLACTILDASVASGRTKINAAAQASCVAGFEDYLKNAGCPYGAGLAPLFGIDRTNAACTTIYEGTVAAGGGCKGPHECVAGLTCVGYTNDADGKCVTPPALDQPCGAARTDAGYVSLDTGFGDHPGCAPGAYCFVDKCVAQKAPGETCTDHEQCNGTKCYLGTCGGATDRAPSGGACKSTSDCQSGLACHVPADGAMGTCGAPKPAGQTCSGKAVAECLGRCELPDGGGAGTCVVWCGSK